ncbi:MAG: UPF0175 family protein [Chloroflexi bacterium]|nr:UPF0175 family protein [Chloroflexota bacterium]
MGIVHGDLVVKNRYEPATFEQIVKVQLLFLAIFYDFAANCTKLTLAKLQKQQPKLVDDALQKMIEGTPDLAWSLVISAYLDEEINLGKAAEMLDIHELELRDRFIELGIPLRIGSVDKVEARAEAQALDFWFSQEDNARRS